MPELQCNLRTSNIRIKCEALHGQQFFKPTAFASHHQIGFVHTRQAIPQLLSFRVLFLLTLESIDRSWNICIAWSGAFKRRKLLFEYFSREQLNAFINSRENSDKKRKDKLCTWNQFKWIELVNTLLLFTTTIGFVYVAPQTILNKSKIQENNIDTMKNTERYMKSVIINVSYTQLSMFGSAREL